MADLRSQLQEGLGGSYALERELGRGGMATVFGEGRRGVELLPVSANAFNGPYMQHQLSRIYILTGKYDQAVETLEPLLKLPYFLSPGWLRINPTFDPLRSNPRFKRLVQGASDQR
jgi:hypothetical protein